MTLRFGNFPFIRRAAVIIGMIPMAIGIGEGGEQNAPLGRVASSQWAVMKMVGSGGLIAASIRRKAMPPMPGIFKSRIRQSVSGSRPASRNSSAESKLSARQPMHLISDAIASRTDSSSSTMATSGLSS